MPTSYPDRAVPRYRRVRCTLWTEPRFVALSITEKLVHLYLSTGPQTNAVGLYRLSVAALAEDLGIRPKIAQTAVMNVIQSMTWRYDNPTRLLWIPTWADENAPQSPNVCKAWRKALNEIQPCALRDEAEHAIRTFLTSIGKAFAEAFGKALPEAFDGSFGIQEQEAGHQEHDQEVSTHMPRAREGEHRAHVFCSERTHCVPSFIHEELQKALGGVNPANAQQLMTWYAAVSAARGSGSIEGSAPEFWRAEYRTGFREAQNRSAKASMSGLEHVSDLLDKCPQIETINYSYFYAATFIKGVLSVRDERSAAWITRHYLDVLQAAHGGPIVVKPWETRKALAS